MIGDATQQFGDRNIIMLLGETGFLQPNRHANALTAAVV
jgi:hypothetical protein